MNKPLKKGKKRPAGTNVKLRKKSKGKTTAADGNHMKSSTDQNDDGHKRRVKKSKKQEARVMKKTTKTSPRSGQTDASRYQRAEPQKKLSKNEVKRKIKRKVVDSSKTESSNIGASSRRNRSSRNSGTNTARCVSVIATARWDIPSSKWSWRRNAV